MSLTTPLASIPRQRIVDVDWTLDVLIASGELPRVGVPIICLSITVSNDESNNSDSNSNSDNNNNNNTVLQYRLTVHEFHQWRFTMAKVVRDLLYLEKKDALARHIRATEILEKSSVS
ncbi:uncharacterized protein TM35_000281440 [Trypanosoma theileri]|uniref:COMM domain-containing protein n=1 Tax=Trypanosoma theileri TaxID=67003 RepID=A0A1X0NPH8_9TRYP|nr:uncharacterized protein TM35_000281440 [Trypanosoma theileri]ORC86428.1 hypothetical protein TM35_000281440 [Trypanosoma theileri]